MPGFPEVARSAPAVHGPRRPQRRPMLGHWEGTAGEDQPGSGVAAMVTSSGDGLGSSSVTTSLVGKRSVDPRLREAAVSRETSSARTDLNSRL